MSKRKSAAELMAELQKNEGFVAQQEERERERLRDAQELREALAPLLRDLEAIGVKIASLAELPKEARVVPVLVKWLPLTCDTRAKEAIVRALSVPSARPDAARSLIMEFLRSTDDQAGLRWAIGNALEVVADESVFDDLVALAKDQRHGKAREMLTLALGNMTDPRAVDVLLDLLKDEEVAGHAVMALGKLSPSKARSALEPFLRDPRPWVRKEAKRAVGGIDGARAR